MKRLLLGSVLGLIAAVLAYVLYYRAVPAEWFHIAPELTRADGRLRGALAAEQRVAEEAGFTLEGPRSTPVDGATFRVPGPHLERGECVAAVAVATGGRALVSLSVVDERATILARDRGARNHVRHVQVCALTPVDVELHGTLERFVDDGADGRVHWRVGVAREIPWSRFDQLERGNLSSEYLARLDAARARAQVAELPGEPLIPPVDLAVGAGARLVPRTEPACRALYRAARVGAAEAVHPRIDPTSVEGLEAAFRRCEPPGQPAAHRDPEMLRRQGRWYRILAALDPAVFDDCVRVSLVRLQDGDNEVRVLSAADGFGWARSLETRETGRGGAPVASRTLCARRGAEVFVVPADDDADHRLVVERVEGRPSEAAPLEWLREPAPDPRLGQLERACDGADGFEACEDLSHALATGIFAPPDPEAAFRPLERACDAGRAETCRDLGFALRVAEGDAADPARSAALLRRACEDGDARACAGVADLDRLDGDYEAAAAGYARACEAGVATACRNRARMILLWLPRSARQDRAELSAERACELGDPGGCFELARVLRDPLHAERWRRFGMRSERRCHSRLRRALRQACRGGVEAACDASWNRCADG